MEINDSIKMSKTNLCEITLVGTLSCYNKDYQGVCDECPYFKGLQVVGDNPLIECSYCPTEEDLEWCPKGDLEWPGEKK